MSSTHSLCDRFTEQLQAMPYYDLVLRCQEGSRPEKNAFAELIRRYHPYVEKLLYHLAPDWNDRADLAQDVWLRVFKNIKYLREPMKFHGWLSRITTNLFCTELRKRKRVRTPLSLDTFFASEEGELGWKIASNQPDPAEVLATQEFYEQLQAAIAALPEMFRLTIMLRELNGMTYEEIAALTGVPMGTVKSRILRARQRLQCQLQGYLREHVSPLTE
ncbi:MAG TPA: sigma-70 family RNA polymerase sigma factor [Allocoleopsis sp.]